VAPPQAELVIGLMGPIGAPLKDIESHLRAALKRVNYVTEPTVKLTELLTSRPEYAGRIGSHRETRRPEVNVEERAKRWQGLVETIRRSAEETTRWPAWKREALGLPGSIGSGESRQEAGSRKKGGTNAPAARRDVQRAPNGS
jgi:hypothetical protein